MLFPALTISPAQAMFRSPMVLATFQPPRVTTILIVAAATMDLIVDHGAHITTDRAVRAVRARPATDPTQVA